MPMQPFDLGLGFSSSNTGAAGGGNVFNAAPLFGSLFGQSGSTSGDNAAGATSAAQASGKGSGQSGSGGVILPGSSGVKFNLSAWLPWIIAGAALIVAAALAWKLFKK